MSRTLPTVQAHGRASLCVVCRRHALDRRIAGKGRGRFEASSHHHQTGHVHLCPANGKAQTEASARGTPSPSLMQVGRRWRTGAPRQGEANMGVWAQRSAGATAKAWASRLVCALLIRPLQLRLGGRPRRRRAHLFSYATSCLSYRSLFDSSVTDNLCGFGLTDDAGRRQDAPGHGLVVRHVDVSATWAGVA